MRVRRDNAGRLLYQANTTLRTVATAAMSSMFPIHFHQHVIPRLRRLATAEAFCVVRGAEDWTGAFDSLMAYARRYGAMYLSERMFYELDDWLSTTLLEEIARQETELSATVADAT